MPARIVLGMAFTLALAPLWLTHAPAGVNDLSGLAVGLLSEATIGLAIGVVVGIVIEIFQMAAQVVSLQAGFSYASTIDPTSGADSPVLVTLSQLVAALLFVTTGVDRALLRILADSVAFNPPGHTWTAHQTYAAGNAVFHFASNILSIGLRLAAPIAVLLILADLLLAVFGRLQPQLQLTTLSFPCKLLATMLILPAMIRFYPRFFENAMDQALRLIERLLHGG